MKKLMLILFLSSLCLGQFLPNDEDLSKMSYAEKSMIYSEEKKSPMWAIVWQVVPTASYAYINDWKRGLKFLGIEASLAVLGIYIYESRRGSSYEENGDEIAQLLWTTTGILKLYEYVDLYKQTNKYNQQLHNKIFGKKDNNFSFLILPTSDGAYLNLSYKF